MREKKLYLLVGASLVALLTANRAMANPPGAAGAAAADGCEMPANVAPENARKTADDLFNRAKRLREQGKVASACACLDASDRLAPGRGGTVLSLGLCHEQEGKLAAAYRELRQALAKAREDGRADREALANERLAVIEPKLAWLAITLPANAVAARATVQLDGAAVEAASLGAVPVDGGPHVVTVTANGFEARRIDVALTAGERRAVNVEPLVSTAPTNSPATPPPAANSNGASSLTLGPASPPPMAPSQPATESRGGDSVPALRTAALVAGIVGMAVSLGSGAWALERKGAVNSNCNDDKECNDDGVSAASTGRALVVVGTAAFAVGALGFGAWALLPNESGDGGSAAAGGLTVRGVF